MLPNPVIHRRSCLIDSRQVTRPWTTDRRSRPGRRIGRHPTTHPATCRRATNSIPQGRTRAGGPLRYPNWRRRVWLAAAEAAACRGAGFHDLRRLNATSLTVGGVDMKTAQVRLGHADPLMTLAVCASAPASADRAAADVLGETFFGDTTR